MVVDWFGGNNFNPNFDPRVIFPSTVYVFLRGVLKTDRWQVKWQYYSYLPCDRRNIYFEKMRSRDFYKRKKY